MRYFLGIAIVFLCIASCSIEDSSIPTLEVGAEFTDSTVRLFTVDTFTVELSTFKFDSIVTSDSDRLLFGQYEDEFFGTVRASSYMELTAPVYELPSDADLDSVALILGYDSYFYNDTTQVATVNVHLLTDEIVPEEDFFFNTSKLPFEPSPMATMTFMAEPIDEDSLHILLPFDFGKEIFDLIQENDIEDNNDLRNQFKGITIQPSDTDNAAILGFSRAQNRTYIRFFYTVPGEFGDEEETFDLSIETGLQNAFNNIVSDVSGTSLEGLDDQEINLSSFSSDNKSFIQSGVGYATRIRFPTLKNIFEVEGDGTLLSANLQIKSPRDSYNDILPIRDSLSVNVIDQNNEITEPLFNGLGFVLGALNTENEEFNDIFYEIPVGVYVDRKITETTTIDDALIIFPPEYNSTVDRIVLNDSRSDDFEAKLVITYAIYDDEE